MTTCASDGAAFDLLLACYRSGQISERQWQEHLKDEALGNGLRRQAAAT